MSKLKQFAHQSGAKECMMTTMEQNNFVNFKDLSSNIWKAEKVGKLVVRHTSYNY